MLNRPKIMDDSKMALSFGNFGRLSIFMKNSNLLSIVFWVKFPLIS